MEEMLEQTTGFGICMEIRSKASPASILISLICMIDSLGKNTGIIQKTPSRLVFLYSFNVVLGLLDEVLELKEIRLVLS